jgi:pimeloyl-ACP methyl ester carboxylesterase
VESCGTGRPLLLIHGFGATLYTWRRLVPALAERHRVIAVDLKGSGRAPKPADGHYSVVDQAGYVAALIEGEDLSDLTVVGHSFGGGVALAALVGRALSPARVRSLVLIDSMAYRQRIPWFIAALRVPVLGPSLLRLSPPELQVRLVLRAGYHEPRRITDDVVAAYAAPLRDAAARRALIDTARAIPPRDADALAARYGAIAVPTLLLWGRYDTIVPLAVGGRLHRAIPASRLAVIDDAGHLPHEERPGPVLRELERFLA